MIYCKHCLYPNTKPDLWFNEKGICSACISYEMRKTKDWKKLEELFHETIRIHKSHPIYDCIVPVSGGKDSHYQIIQMLKFGYKPLAVCARTDDLSLTGRANLDNIAKMGVDLIEINTNRNVRGIIANYALVTIGDISWSEHVTIFTVPFIVAKQMGINLIIYGENPQNEYGGPEGTDEVTYMDENWLAEFGGLNGLRVDDLVEKRIAKEENLFYYRMPQNVKQVKAIFLGQFFKWDGIENAKIARNYGFKWYHSPVEGSGVMYENLDNHQTGIHDYFKYLKFGFGRATDIACNMIRRKIWTIKQAKAHVATFDGVYPLYYMGQHLDATLSKIGMDRKEFNKVTRKFMNKNIFEIDKNGEITPKFTGDLYNA